MFPHMYVKILALGTYWGFAVCIYLFAFDLFGGVFLSSFPKEESPGTTPINSLEVFFLVGNLF